MLIVNALFQIEFCVCYISDQKNQFCNFLRGNSKTPWVQQRNHSIS